MKLDQKQVQKLIALVERDVSKINPTNEIWEHWISSELQNSYIDLIATVEPFDWTNWSKGIDAIQSGSDFLDFNPDELSKALLSIWRGNRFTDGLWAKYLRDGTILRILQRLSSYET